MEECQMQQLQASSGRLDRQATWAVFAAGVVLMAPQGFK